MQDADLAQTGETLESQYTLVKKLTNKSHVLQFGDTSIDAEAVTAFEGAGKPSPPAPGPSPTPPSPTPPSPTPPSPSTCPSSCGLLPKFLKCAFSKCSSCPDCKAAVASPEAALLDVSAMPSADAAISSAFHRFLAGSDAAAEELMRGIAQRQAATRRFEEIAMKVAGRKVAALGSHDGDFDHECHYTAYKAYISACGEWDEHALAHSATLAKLCKHTAGQVAGIASAISGACSAHTVEVP